MKSKIFYTKNNDYSDIIGLIVESILKKQIVIMPSDTIYGFLGTPDIEDEIRNIKERDSKPFLYLISDYQQLNKLKINSNYNKGVVRKYWPGEVTFIFRQNSNSTIGVRMPKQPFLKKILGRVNLPLISTSVNVSGNSPINEPSQIIEYFGNKVDIIVVDNDFIPAISSTIVDITDGTCKILRQGNVIIQ